MKNATVTVIPKSQLANANILMESIETYLDGWDRFVYILDLNANELQEINKEVLKHAEYVAADSLIENYEDIAFFFNKDELREYIKLKAIQALLTDYDNVFLCESTGLFYNKPTHILDILTSPDIVVKIKKKYLNKNQDTFLLINDKDRVQSTFVGLSKGKKLIEFISWAISKFDYLIRNAITSTESLNPQHLFIFSWQYYFSVFDIEVREVPRSSYMTLQNNVQSSCMSDEIVFISFIQSKNSKKSGSGLSGNREYDSYQERISCFNEKYAIGSSYRYDFFSDGTKIFKLLRPYYFRNYRLRDKCRHHPFENRAFFTEATVIIGDENEIPLNAAADCIWRKRTDLQTCFPNYVKNDRPAYINWFLTYAVSEYELPQSYYSSLAVAYNRYVKRHEAVSLAKNIKIDLLHRAVRKIKREMCHKESSIVSSSPPDYSQFPSGVNLCGFIRGEFGLGEATRILARILNSGKIMFSIVNYEILGVHRYTNHEWDSKIKDEFIYNTNIMLINADGIPEFFKTVSPKTKKDRYNIGFLYWELPEYPDSWVSAFDYFDEIWTASEFSAEAFRKKTALPVYCLPCCVTVDTNPDLDRKHFNLPEDKFLFLMMYDVRSMQERKNPKAVIDAFLKAFGDSEDVTLVIKINGPNDWEFEDELIDSIKHRSNILLVIGTFDKIEVNSLINCCDAFVSLHRSEGFGLGPAEAMYLGKPAILTNWSGNKVYMTEDNCCPVNYKIIEIDKDYGPYKKGYHWAEPSSDHAAAYMRRLVEDQDYYDRISENGKKTIRKEFSPEAICESAKSRLKELGLIG